MGRGRGLAGALGDIWSKANFAIAVMAALIGYLLVAISSQEICDSI